ncbi:bifunctional protein-serine/threonine kinase/phosphatase [Marinomonas sp. M1K-6]|uniref:Bifunctional protein-serine/threonine kinase/phosphatase n=1 Tax=Marinomonas profundi TaxID=2726122 RepID=A0A847R187_9GAMM|nr:bifunctional protein-serine/threonine kinase/phosphatase [Marinomonas profundi]NLQ17435.1 bifunctional protein-serine/threonine kinase/phosphatase [Marinomonas profundi]UDV01960.1 bifunctional protein-serine/threonine kinase/phosphatase [Marinomonas profundi]
MKVLSISIGRATNKGKKDINQDGLGGQIPAEPLLSTRGVALAIADGISSSSVSQVASEFAITRFLEDFYHTSDAWSVKTSGEKVINSINAALYSQSQNGPSRFDKDKGYVCTFSAIVLCSNTAHIFHLGDSRVYRLVDGKLEQLTKDHRRIVSANESYLTRALGIAPILEWDYQLLPMSKGDIFVMATDGVYEFVDAEQVVTCIAASESLDQAAEHIISQALSNGSDDNLSIQIARVDEVPSYQQDDVQHNISLLPLPPPLRERMSFDGYEILRSLYVSSRSHVFLARDTDSNERVVIKVPSAELSDDAAYLERFMLEGWIAKRIHNPHVVKAIESPRQRQFLYLVTHYIEGQSLTQWMIDNPKPTLEQTRHIISQIANGLQAFHRKSMIHQDIRPANIMIDKHGTVKIIDFGSTHIAGVSNARDEDVLRGTMRYSAPEYFLGHAGSERSDIYALGVIAYQMLSANQFPYSPKIAQAKSIAAQRRLRYRSVITEDSELPVWIDDALHKALQIDPLKRYEEVSEFVYDLHQPNQTFLDRTRPPLIQRNPVMFWQGVSFLLFLVIIFLCLEKF